MNTSILRFTATALLVMTVHTSFAAERTHAPATALAAAEANLISRAERALRGYVAACSTGDDEALARIVTSDAVVEYALKEPGMYLVVEATALSAKRWRNAKRAGAGASISKLWIFPTNDSNVVFVQYATSSDFRSPEQLADAEHLALLEMRGDRILKLRYFSADARTFSPLEASALTCAIASSRANAHD